MNIRPLTILNCLLLLNQEILNEQIRVATQTLNDKRLEIMEKKRSTNDDNPLRLEKKMKAVHLKIANIRNKYS